MIKKLLIISVLVFFSNCIWAQNGEFEKGYYIDNNNNKVDCLINNLDWNYNPNQFEYKTEENAIPKTMLFSEFKEFSVGTEYKFVKATVKIDKTSDKIDSRSSLKTMNFVEDELVLRVRVEGKASLYSYNNGEYLRFFYSTATAKFVPLSYKVYFNLQESEYAKNETYKQELLNTLKCDNISQTDINHLQYSSSSLTDFFIKYNTCSGELTDKFVAKKVFDTFDLFVKAGVGISSFSLDFAGYNADFDKKAFVRASVEAEINFSNSFKKWSVVFEPSYLRYNNTYTFNTTTNYKSKLDYTLIDLSFGFKRYVMLNKNTFLFIRGNISYGMPIHQSELTFSGTVNGQRVITSMYPSLGIGALYDKKYLVDIRYEYNKELFSIAQSKMSTIAVMMGYKFF
jgi:hypothetical protein